MRITLPPCAQTLLKQLANERPVEELVEGALERLVAERLTISERIAPSEAIDHIRQLRRGGTLEGFAITELIDGGRKS